VLPHPHPHPQSQSLPRQEAHPYKHSRRSRSKPRTARDLKQKPALALALLICLLPIGCLLPSVYLQPLYCCSGGCAPRSGPCRSPCTCSSRARARSGPRRSPCTSPSRARARKFLPKKYPLAVALAKSSLVSPFTCSCAAACALRLSWLICHRDSPCSLCS
jgi:hypothetical protein